MIAAIYARKSQEQSGVADDAKSVTRQVDGARAFISAKGWTLDEHHVYTDDGVSGALFANREQFQRLMREAEAGAFEAVVFYDLDRFGRNARHVYAALNTLADLGISIWDYSTGQPVDLDSFEGDMMTFMKARFAQQYRDQVKKHTRDAMRQKAEAGYVTGGLLFGYDNVRVAKGQTTRVINEAEASVIRLIYQRFASGEGLRTIALALNQAGALSPRAQRGRPSGWAASSVREVLQRSAYRGELIFGKTTKVDARELRKRDRQTTREHGQVPTPEASWVRREQPELRIIDVELAASVDARRAQWQSRAVAAKASHRAPQNASGKYLLSGGMLICPTCGGHFEAFKSPWKADGVYVCSTRRRKPGTCTNTLTLSISETDDAILDIVQDAALGSSFIEELLALVDRGEADMTAARLAERDRVQHEISNLMELAASGVAVTTIAPKVQEREKQIAKLDVELRRPKTPPPNIEHLRLALYQRAEHWKATLRAEPKVARLLLRRLIGPLTLVDPTDVSGFVEWEASLTPALLEELKTLAETPIQVVASPTGFEPVF